MPLDLNQIPLAPHIVAPFEPILAGVDFLNLRQANLDLMAECVPGTNNTTRLVRGYSLMAWIYWIYPRILAEKRMDEANRDELVLFREKVESLFVWGHQLAGIGGLPGVTSKVPPARNGLVDLRFKAWKRSRTNTSLQAAVQYGPSLLDFGGLGLLQKIENDIYACTQAGSVVGEALDVQLRRCPEYAFLTDLTASEGTEDQARSLFPFWRIDETSPVEAEAFRSVLWNPSHADERSSRGRRASMIELLLATLANSKHPLDIDEIRRRLAIPGLWNPSTLPPGQLRQSRSWLVLQLRQLQRLALEGIMSWIEVTLIPQGHQLPDEIVTQATRLICEEFDLQPDASAEQAIQLAESPIGDLAEFQKRITNDPDWFSPWELAAEIGEAIENKISSALTSGFYSLLFLYQCRPFLEQDEHLARHIEHGGTARVSLAHWFRTVDRLRSRSCRELVDWVIKNLIISQHFATGTQRFDGEKIRLRMILDEDGLESLVKWPWQPALTPDRLGALLSLLASIGVIEEMEDSTFRLVKR